MSDDAWGCLGAIALLAGGIWLYNHYEIKPKDTAPKMQTSAALPPLRPTGMMPITETESGSVWRLDTDSVRGDRQHRQGWVVVDATKDKTATNWRTQKVLYHVDCDTTATRELSQIFYDAKGNVTFSGVDKAPKDAKPDYYPEGTVGYAPVRAMCVEEFDAPQPRP